MTTTSSNPVRGTSAIWATGLASFASVLLILLGVFGMFEGLAALADDEILVAVDGYVYHLDITAWGWVHLLVGAGAALTGVFLARGASWARVAGMLFAGLSAFVNFLFIPYYPLWTIVIIALDVAVIWALATYDADRS